MGTEMGIPGAPWGQGHLMSKQQVAAYIPVVRRSAMRDCKLVKRMSLS